MKYIKNLFAITALLFLIVSCEKMSTDLNVENFEHPNADIIKSDPVALEATASNLMNKWFMGVHSYRGPAAAMATMADISTCSWGNFGMNDLSSEPRVAFNNKTSYGNNVTDSYFNRLYALLADANMVVGAVNAGTEFENQDAVAVMGLLGQSLSIGYLALVFDQIWISDEDGLVGEGSSTHQAAMTYALAKLDEAIALVSTNAVTIPEAWLPGGGGESGQFLAFLNSMGARMLVGNVRNSAQKADISWSKVLTYTNAGLTTDFTIFMDDQTWYDLIPKTYLIYPGWGRVDMRVINMMDPNTVDYWTDDIVSLPESTSADARLASDYGYLSSNNFRPTRGKYHFSSYRYKRYDSYISNWIEDVVEYSASENAMYKAEALLNTGDVSGAADVVNAGTRTTRGELVDVAADADAVYDAIHYERLVEFAYTGAMIGFFEMRKENLLQAGTLLHFPVPGKSLEAIPADYYTFGGTEGVAGEDYSTGGWKAAANANYFKSTTFLVSGNDKPLLNKHRHLQ